MTKVSEEASVQTDLVVNGEVALQPTGAAACISTEYNSWVGGERVFKRIVQKGIIDRQR